MHGATHGGTVCAGHLAARAPILARPAHIDRPAMFRNRLLRHYLLGIACIVMGAGVTSATDSMLPLAMGGAVGLMCTWTTVRAILQGKLKAAKRR